MAQDSQSAIAHDEYPHRVEKIGECSVCAAMTDTDSAYCQHLFADNGRRDLNGEAIADAFGFCAAHAALLAERSDVPSAAADALSLAISKVLDLLERHEKYDKRLQPVLFSAPGACPICRFRKHHLKAHIHRLLNGVTSCPPGQQQSQRPIPVCVPHFRAAVSASGQAVLKTLAERQIEFLLSATAPILSSPQTAKDPNSVDDAASIGALRSALHALAASPWLSTLYLRGRREQLGARAFDNLDALLGGEACPVCACISRVLDQWVELTDKAARIGLGLWMVFPTCPTHIWICAHLCGSATAHQVARYVSEIMIESLQRAVAAMAREDQERGIASKSVWFKQNSPSYLLGQRRKLVTRMPRCPACECFAVARDRAIGRLLDLIQDQRHRRTLELGHGLCLKHFADAYLIAPKAAVRDALTAIHMAKLSAAKQELAPLFALSRASNTDRLPGPVAAVWRRALYRVSPAV